MIRLDRYLATLGVGSRSQVQKLIRQGAARVDGVPVRDPGFACREGADLTVNGEMLDSRPSAFNLRRGIEPPAACPQQACGQDLYRAG